LGEGVLEGEAMSFHQVGAYAAHAPRYPSPTMHKYSLERERESKSKRERERGRERETVRKRGTERERDLKLLVYGALRHYCKRF
jgi:hypothetical protein